MPQVLDPAVQSHVQHRPLRLPQLLRRIMHPRLIHQITGTPLEVFPTDPCHMLRAFPGQTDQRRRPSGKVRKVLNQDTGFGQPVRHFFRRMSISRILQHGAHARQKTFNRQRIPRTVAQIHRKITHPFQLHTVQTEAPPLHHFFGIITPFF